MWIALVGLCLLLGCDTEPSPHEEWTKNQEGREVGNKRSDTKDRHANAKYLELIPATQVLVGGDHVVEFELVNCSDRPVAVNSITTSCGCTSARFPNKRLAPGESRAVTINLHAHQLGKGAAAFTVASDRDQQLLTGRIEWNGVFPIEVTPSAVEFGTVAAGKQHSAIVELKTNDETQAKDLLTGISTHPADLITASVADGGGSASVDITLDAHKHIRNGKGAIRLEFKEPLGKVEVPVYWTAVDEISVQPENVYVGSISTNEAFSAKCMIRALNDHIVDVQITPSTGEMIDATEVSLSNKQLKSGVWQCVLGFEGVADMGPFVRVVRLKVTTEKGISQTLDLKTTGIVSTSSP
jgi:hypothetical protein